MTSGWFLTELIFRIHNSSSPDLYQFDKQMRLLRAGSSREAYQHALVMASHTLDKQNNDPEIQWEFAGIGFLQTIEKPEDKSLDNIELYYTLETPGAAKEYMLSLRAKNAILQMQIAMTAWPSTVSLLKNYAEPLGSVFHSRFFH